MGSDMGRWFGKSNVGKEMIKQPSAKTKNPAGV
jgi:hypothetical protein